MGSCSALDFESADHNNEGFLRETPVKVNSRKKTIESHDFTPIKHPVALKRRSLIRDMNWMEDVQTTKHPMEMRLRRCRRPKIDYCNPEEYDDYAEDLSFLFDDDLPNLECRPRRKSRKKRPHLVTKTSNECEVEFFSAPSLEKPNTSNFTCKDFSEKKPKIESSSETFRNGMDFPGMSTTIEHRKRKSSTASSHLEGKRLKRTSMLNKCITNNRPFLLRKVSLRLDCALDQITAPIPESTVTKMTLRRRHSIPAFERNVKPSESFSRTAAKRDSIFKDLISTKAAADDFSFGEIEFVDSPDSGFSSETGCSVGTPDVDTFSISKCEEPLKPMEQGGFRLNLNPDSIREKERVMQEKLKKKEDEELLEKFRCEWEGCRSPHGSKTSSELHEHLEKCHAQNYSCRWKGCKVFGKASRKLSFLRRHIGEHSGEKPYKCILDGCDATFSSLSSRKRHVEAHYSEVSYPKARVGNETGPFPRHVLNSRRIKDKRRTLANRHDCMDNRTMSFIKMALVQNEFIVQNDAMKSLTVNFTSQVIGRKWDKYGDGFVLVRWKPEGILPDEWLRETDLAKNKKVARNELPEEGRNLIKSLFFSKKSTKVTHSTPATPLVMSDSGL